MWKRTHIILGGTAGGLLCIVLACAKGADPDADAPNPDAGDRGIGSVCPLDEEARPLVVRAAETYLRDAVWVAQGNRPVEVHTILHVLGGEGIGNMAFLAARCTEPIVHDEYCEHGYAPGEADRDHDGVGDGVISDEFAVDHARCLRVACEDADVTVTTQWFTMRPFTSVDTTHPFVARTTDPPGIAAYAENPAITWRADHRDPSRVEVDADVYVNAVLVPVTGARVDLRHEGHLSATWSREDERLTAEATVTFARAGAKPVTVALAVDETGHARGEISSLGASLAHIDAPFDPEQPLAPTWSGPCR